MMEFNEESDQEKRIERRLDPEKLGGGVPPHEDPQFDRDKDLPKSPFG